MLSVILFFLWVLVFTLPLVLSFKKDEKKNAYKWVLSRFKIAWFVIGLVEAFAFSTYFNLYTDYLSLAEDLKAPQVFWTLFSTKIALGFLAFSITFSIFTIIILMSRRLWLNDFSWIENPLKRRGYGLKMEDVTNARNIVTWVTEAAALVISVIIGFIAAGKWESFLLFRNSSSFGILDPIFHKDVGFYVLRLGWISFVWWTLFWVFFFCAVKAAAFSATDFWVWGKEYAPADVKKRLFNRAVSHLASIFAVMTVIIVGLTQVAKWHLLYSPHGAVYGVGWTDVHVRLPVFTWTAIVCVVGFLMFLAAIVAKSVKATRNLVIAAVSLVFGWLLCVQTIWPAMVEHFYVQPSQISLEPPFIQNHVRFTRDAYGLSSVDTVSFAGTGIPAPFSTETIEEYKAVLNNIRLWDWRVAHPNLDQSQGFRQYYTFADVDVDRYTLPEGERQVMLALRELKQDRLPNDAASWQNFKTVYTHGFGYALFPTNEAIGEGEPNLWVHDVPVTSDIPGGFDKVEPRIYYGELTTTPVFAPTTTNEVDYGKEDVSAYTHYAGKGGILLTSWWRKFAFAVGRDEGIRILTTSQFTDSTRYLWRRTLRERVHAVAPFITLDQDEYAVADLEGRRLVLMVDGYTTSDKYPYSSPYHQVTRNLPLSADSLNEMWENEKVKFALFRRSKEQLQRQYGGSGGSAIDQDVNYIRNSVKFVMDCYDGTLTGYVFDKSDPVIRTWEKVFPGIFKPASAMPAFLRKHIRYPEDYLRIQAIMYGTFHMTHPQVFLNKEDVWTVGKEIYDNETKTIDTLPYFVITKLHGSETDEFVLMLPMTPNTKEGSTRRNNLVAWVAGRCDGESYGRLEVITFNRTHLVDGPLLVEQRISQDTKAATDILLWSKTSHVIRGNMLCYPLGNTILYVEPTYLQAQVSGKSGIPQLKKVAVADKTRLGWGDTFEDALEKMLGKSQLKIKEHPGEEQAQAHDQAPGQGVLENVFDHWKKMVGYEQQGKWLDAAKEKEAIQKIIAAQ